MTGAYGGSFNTVPQNAASSSWILQPTASLSQGSYAITASAQDTFSRTGTATADITVTQAADYGKVYTYTSTRTGAASLSDLNYDSIMGITSENTSLEPDLITGYQSGGPSQLCVRDACLGHACLLIIMSWIAFEVAYSSSHAWEGASIQGPVSGPLE